MKTLTVLGKDESGEVLEFTIVNPLNVVVSKGYLVSPGELTDPRSGQPIPKKEEITLLRVGGMPIMSTEKREDVLKKIEEL
jgi:hypothetical protein